MKNTQPNTNRIFAIDFIRLVAIIAVLLIHTTARTLESTNLNIDLAPFAFFLNQISRFAVPLFFLVSGYVLHLSAKPNASVVQFYSRRIQRLIIPYLFWSLLYVIFVYPGQERTLSQILLLGWASYQLYFIPSLLLLYAIFPLLSRFVHKISLIHLIVFGLAWLSMQGYFYYLGQDILTQPILVAILNFFLFVVGITAAAQRPQFKAFINKWGGIFILLTLMIGILIYLEGKFWYQLTNNYLFFYSQWRPSMTIYTLIMFISLYQITKNIHYNRFVHRLAQLSFFVYFIHVAVLEFYWKLGLNNLATHSYSFYFDMLYFSLVTITSFSIGYFIHKTPKLSRLTG